MCSPTLALTAIGTVVSTYSQYAQGQAQAQATKMAGRNNQAIAEYNAKMLEQNAEIQRRAKEDSLTRGAQDAATIRENTRKLNARGRAIMGSSGLLVDTGTNLSLLGDNTVAGEVNALTTFNNAERESYGYAIAETDAKNQAKNTRYQGELGMQTASYNASIQKQAGLLGATSTLVTGAGNFAKLGGFDSQTYKNGWKWK